MFNGMKKSDFEIGVEFWTATGKWVCTDTGTRVIVAKKSGNDSDAEVVFDKYDFGGCSKEPRIEEKITKTAQGTMYEAKVPRGMCKS